MVKKVYCIPADRQSAPSHDVDTDNTAVRDSYSCTERSAAVPRIGRLIEQELRRQERTVSWLSRKIHCDRRNIYFIFERDTIDTGLLLRISRVLGVDFFACYSRLLLSESLSAIKE